MSKITKIPSEIRNILSEKRRYSVMDSFSRLLESFHLESRCLGGNKRENCQLTNLHLFQILVLMPFFRHKRIFPLSLFGFKPNVRWQEGCFVFVYVTR